MTPLALPVVSGQFMIMKMPVTILLFALLTSEVHAAKPASIVGKWRFVEETCDQAIRIGPMSLDSEDVACRFTSVKREGRRVTWMGSCDDAEGGSSETVTATENNGRLTIRYINGGSVLSGLVRCPK